LSDIVHYFVSLLTTCSVSQSNVHCCRNCIVGLCTVSVSCYSDARSLNLHSKGLWVQWFSNVIRETEVNVFITF